MGELKLPRCYFIAAPEDPISSVELHGFSDGSEVAYGACVYLKCVRRSGMITAVLVTSKSRLVPISKKTKKLTVPRVELMGNLLLSILIDRVLRAFEIELFISKVFCWTDSRISLAWIKDVDKEFTKWIDNRLLKIRKNVPEDNWYYVRTNANPADLVTRSGNDVKPSMWFNGPEFLYQSSFNYYEAGSHDDEVRKETDYVNELNNKATVMVTTPGQSLRIGNIMDIGRYNDYLKLVRVAGYVMRFVGNLKRIVRDKKPAIKSDYLNASEIFQAERMWILDNQNTLVNEKFDSVKINLNLKCDEEGVMRSYSRLKHAKIPFDTKAPIFIDREHKLAKILVYYYHTKVMHRGVKQTLTEFRSRFWITRGRSFMRKLIKPCKTCRILNARAYEYPNSADLPDFRFDERHPFASTGVDYLGPLYCLPVFGDDEKMHKAWVALYTCMSTRAIILEVVNNANADGFLNSFKRFLARRGCPDIMVSDNGSVFTAKETQKFAAERGIHWKLNIDEAPWTGGVWERLVSCVKRCMKKVVGTKKLTYVELQTLVCEIEMILNNRPIGVDYDDDQEDILTPNHLVFGRRLNATNEDGCSTMSTNEDNRLLGKRKKVLDKMLSHFWERWRKEYVTSLRDYQRTSKQKHSSKIRVDDVVIIYEDKQPRHRWKIGRVEETITGRDGRIRSAIVKVGKSGASIKRPVNRLFPLVQADVDEDQRGGV